MHLNDPCCAMNNWFDNDSVSKNIAKLAICIKQVYF